MRTLNPMTRWANCDFTREVRANVASAEARRTESGGGRVGGWLRWPVAIRRSMGDSRLRRERSFWLAVARTSR